MKLYNRTDIIEGEPEVGTRHHHNRRDHLYNFNDDRSSLSGGSSGGGYGRDLGGHDPGRPSEDMPVLSERDKKELMNLANENISMDFILEMKEAFQLFDKVSKVIYPKYNFNNNRSSLSGGSSGRGYGRDLGGHDPGRPSDDMPVLSERDKKELMNLANENISMVFILEMKEAFLLFDKLKAFLVCAKNGHKMTNSKSCFFINRSEFATLKRP